MSDETKAPAQKFGKREFNLLSAISTAAVNKEIYARPSVTVQALISGGLVAQKEHKVSKIDPKTNATIKSVVTGYIPTAIGKSTLKKALAAAAKLSVAQAA